MGFGVEIDDFGTGRASITGLLKISPDRIKIDKELVVPILEHGPERQFVQMIAQIANALNMETIAEGVETLEHADLLRRMGINTLQGFAFSRPVSASDLEESLTNHEVRQVS